MFNSLISNGQLTISISKTPNRVAHWWTKRFEVNSTCNYFAKIRFKIKGAASLQIGSDWWRDLNAERNEYDPDCIKSNNCEAWASDWFSDTNDRFVTILVPYNDRCYNWKNRIDPILAPIFLLLDKN